VGCEARVTAERLNLVYLLCRWYDGDATDDEIKDGSKNDDDDDDDEKVRDKIFLDLAENW
jgi:hypothetical protein